MNTNKQELKTNMQNLFPDEPRREGVFPPGVYAVELIAICPGGFSTRPSILFCFKDSSSGALITRTVATTRDPRSALLGLVRQLAGAYQPTQQQVDSGELFSAFLESLIGKQFNASITPTPNGRSNNIVAISPINDWHIEEEEEEEL